jgi:hydroxyacyl-ACP dehydratase HTD2-like protein with hotdog domain
MTMIAEHGATVLPFTDALLRAPKARASSASPQGARARTDGPLPDNVVVLARFTRRSRNAHRRHWLGGPPDGEAA